MTSSEIAAQLLEKMKSPPVLDQGTAIDRWIAGIQGLVVRLRRQQKIEAKEAAESAKRRCS